MRHWTFAFAATTLIALLAGHASSLAFPTPTPTPTPLPICFGAPCPTWPPPPSTFTPTPTPTRTPTPQPTPTLTRTPCPSITPWPSWTPPANTPTPTPTSVHLADLSLTVDDSADPVSPGQVFQYILAARNNGPASVHYFSVRGYLSPAAAVRFTGAYTSTDPSLYFCSTSVWDSQRRIECQFRGWGPGWPSTVYVEAVVEDTAAEGLVRLCATVGGSGPDHIDPVPCNGRDCEETAIHLPGTPEPTVTPPLFPMVGLQLFLPLTRFIQVPSTPTPTLTPTLTPTPPPTLLWCPPSVCTPTPWPPPTVTFPPPALTAIP